MKKETESIKRLALACLFVSMGYFSSNAQDSLKIKNRHSIPDTTTPYNDKLKGGALIDTIHIKDIDSSGIRRRDTTSLNVIFNNPVFALQNNDAQSKISVLESDIAELKNGLSKKDVTFKASVATVENKKNELKARLKNNPSPGTKEMERWENDYLNLKKEIDRLK